MPVNRLSSLLRGAPFAAALAIAAALGAGQARAEDIATNGPSLATQAFQQIDGNGVDLISGGLHFKGPDASAGSGSGEVALGLKWNGRGWDLGTPSIWVDEDKSLFVDNGRYVDEFEFISSVGWKSARGNASKVDCIFWNQDRTQMDRCTYQSHDGISIMFGAPSPQGGLPETLSVGMGNVRAYNASVSYPEGQYFNVYAYSNALASQSNLGLGIHTGELYKPQVTMSVRKKPNVANYGIVYGLVISQITINTPGLNYDDRYQKNVLMPKGVTQTMVDPLGQTWSFTFSSAGNLTSIQRPGLAALTIGYDGNRRVTSFSNGAQTWGYFYSSNNGIGTTTVTDPAYGQTIVTYVKKKGNVRSVRDPKGRTTTYEYDTSNRLQKVTFPELNYVVYGYDPRGNLTSTTSYPKPSVGGAPKTIQAFYPPTCPNGGGCNKPTYVLDANNNRWDFTYDGVRPLTVTRPAPVPGGVRPETRFSYASLRVQAMTEMGMRQGSPALPVLTGVSECRTLAGGPAPACANTADEKRTTIGYGTLDGSVENYLWPVTTTVSAGDNSISQTGTRTYDSYGNVLTEDGPLPGPADATRTFYDAGRRIVGAIGPDPDAAGAAVPTATRNTYSGLNQPVLVETGTIPGQSDSDWEAFSPLQRTATAYDAQGRPVTVASAGTGATQTLAQTSYDSLGRERCAAVRMDLAAFPTIYAGGVISGGAIPADACTPDPTPGAQGPDRIERKNYNNASEVTSVERAVGTGIAQVYARYTYSDNGKRLGMADANGNPTAMTYDGHDRLTRTTFPSDVSPGQLNPADYEEYTYDDNGNRLTLRKRDGKTINFAYDGLDRVLQKTAPVSSTGAAGYVVHYGYDNHGSQTFARFDSPSGPGVGTSYDALGRTVQSTTNVDGTLRTLTYTFDARGNRNWLSPGPGEGVGFVYDPLDRMTEIRENGSNTVVTFNYDALGRRSFAGYGNNGIATSSVSYGYDPVGRLQSLDRQLAGSNSDQILGFDYNPASQVVTRTNATTANDYASNTGYDLNRNYVVNGLNQYTQAGIYPYTYDANGNLKSHAATSYVYDAENRLVSAAGDEHNATLSYDPMGRLWQVASGSTATRFLYDGDRLFQEYDGLGNRLRSYVHGPGVDEPLLWYEWTGGALRRFLHSDHLGSIVAVAGEAGDAIKLNGYDSWGLPNPLNLKRFQFTGQVWLSELGLYYYKARIYSPTMGRFLQTDPIGYEDQMNLYAYVGNDPVNGKDPTGKEGWFQWIYDNTVGPGTLYDRLLPQPFWRMVDAFANSPAGDAGLWMAVEQASPYTRGPGAVGVYGSKMLRTVNAWAQFSRYIDKTRPLVGGGAKLENLRPQDIVRIQNAANRTRTQISVVGSRAAGRSHQLSDWDFVLPPGTRSKTKSSLSSSLPEGVRGVTYGRNQEIAVEAVNTQLPYITFFPR